MCVLFSFFVIISNSKIGQEKAKNSKISINEFVCKCAVLSDKNRTGSHQCPLTI